MQMPEYQIERVCCIEKLPEDLERSLFDLRSKQIFVLHSFCGIYD